MPTILTQVSPGYRQVRISSRSFVKIGELFGVLWLGIGAILVGISGKLSKSEAKIGEKATVFVTLLIGTICSFVFLCLWAGFFLLGLVTIMFHSSWLFIRRRRIVHEGADAPV